MKTLLLMRHAKSSWGDDRLADIDRPLNERGQKDSDRIGRTLVQRRVTPDLFISSSALRATETAKLISCHFGSHANSKRHVDARLYAASPVDILDVISEIPDLISVCLVVGHNPGMQELVSDLTATWLPEGMKTGTVACIELDVPEWQLVMPGIGTLKWVLYPRHLTEEQP